jgi:hypothetical protein
MTRACADCQLCCRLLPVRGLRKVAGQKCQHQKFGKGCKVYHKPGMPPECAMWNCRWLVNDDTNDLPRPDRSHYVLDIMPDHVTLEDNETKQRTNVQVVQIWIDPAHPDAHRDPRLRAYLSRRAEQGIAAILRYDSHRATLLFAPSMFSGTPPDGWLQPDGWVEVPHNSPNVKSEPTHTLRDTMKALSR